MCVTSVAVRDEALAGSTPRRRPAADRDRVTSVLDEQHNGRLGIGVALAEHGYRQSDVGQHPAGIKPIGRNVRRTRDMPKLELRPIADVDHHVVAERGGEIVGLNRSTSCSVCTRESKPAELEPAAVVSVGTCPSTCDDNGRSFGCQHHPPVWTVGEWLRAGVWNPAEASGCRTQRGSNDRAPSERREGPRLPIGHRTTRPNDAGMHPSGGVGAGGPQGTWLGLHHRFRERRAFTGGLEASVLARSDGGERARVASGIVPAPRGHASSGAIPSVATVTVEQLQS